MLQWDYFLRSEPDYAIHLPFYTSLLNGFFILLLFHSAKRYATDSSIRRRWAWVNLAQQASLYAWYFFETDLYLLEGLPLYYCRIVMTGLSLLILWKKEEHPLASYLTYLGVFGGCVALLIPNIDPYRFPHITNFSYFIGHFVMLFNCFCLLLTQKQTLSTRQLVSYTGIMTSLILLCNLVLHTNYSYLLHLPAPIHHQLPQVLVFSLVYLLTLLGLFSVRKWQSYLRQTEWQEKDE